MEMLNSVYSTQDLPYTYSFLKKHLPSIYLSKCFNKNNYPFAKEVKSTQIAHLYEHILLEYLSSSKRIRGIKDAVHNGLTKWNWDRDKKGVFYIDIDAGVADSSYFYMAVEKSTLLLSTLLRNSKN